MSFTNRTANGPNQFVWLRASGAQAARCDCGPTNWRSDRNRRLRSGRFRRVFVAYYASAELGCFLALGWSMPARVLDLYAEFRCLTSGLSVPCGHGLLGALAYHGIDGMATIEKTAMRDLAIRGGPFSAGERQALIDYCESDVVALAKLLPAMVPAIDLPRALLRGRYMAAAATMEAAGVPIDAEALATLREHWPSIAGRLIHAIDRDYGVYVPTGRQLDPNSTLGAAIIETAEAAGVDAFRLAETVDLVWAEERAGHAEHDAALSAARKATGLTAQRIDRWEDSGRDYSTWPALDDQARILAAEFPALGIGSGLEQGANHDTTDYAGRLWGLLRSGPRPTKRKDDPDVLRRAVKLAAVAGDGWAGERLSFSERRFAEWLARTGIPWPRLESGALALDDETFRQQAKAHQPLRCAVRHAACGATVGIIGRRPRWTQSVSALGVRQQNGPQSAEQREIYFRAACLAARPSQPADGWAVKALSIGNSKNSASRRRCRATWP